MTEISIAQQFSKYPFGRTEKQGPYSAQAFREKFLEPAFKISSGEIRVVLDGAVGLGSSFLEEAFGGLIRAGIDPSEVRTRIVPISTHDGALVTEIRGYIDSAIAASHSRRAFA